jgi:hypothetical protein
MRVLLGGLVVAASITACGSDGSTTGSTTTPTTRPSTIATVDPDGCPVPDEAFCATASEAANALTAGDAARLVALSRSDTINCAEVEREYFPGCQTDEVLEGFGTSDADFAVELVDAGDYTESVVGLTSGLDTSFADELGDGGARVIGVGTCGPDVPGRRTYHLAWTAAVGAADQDSRRVVGSFEFTLQDDQWRIALTYVDTLERWRAYQRDPLEEAFCAAGRSPWS